MSQRGGDSNSHAAGGGATGGDRGQSYRDFVLQVPGGGLKPGSDEANALQAAEVFLSDLEHEIAAYDRANAEAVKSRVSRWFGFGGASQAPSAPTVEVAGTTTPAGLSSEEADASLAGGVGPGGVAAAAAAVAAGNKPAADSHLHFERRSAADLQQQASASQAAQTKRRWFRRNTAAGGMSYEYKTPLLMRRWVPYVCVAAICVVWIPDMYKLRALHWCDARYAKLRRDIHTEYWRWTMPPDEFAELMQQIEAQIPKHRRSVKSSDCPF